MEHVLCAVTIDTEGDADRNWAIRMPYEFRSVSEGIGEKLMPLLQKYGVRPTFLCSHEILSNDISVSLLKSLKDCELGTHCHWNDPEKSPILPGKSRHYMQGLFSYPEELEQMQQLTDLFQKQIGYSPVSFRAGRFGAGPNTGKILMQLGYRTDSSIVPHASHVYQTGHVFPDHSACLEQPYFVHENGELTQAGKSSLLELPVTVRSIHRRFDPLGVRENMMAWLRPTYSTFSAMKRISAKVFAEKVPVFIIMFHNVEFVPGCSPYASDKSEVDKLLSRLEDFLVFCQKKNVQFATMDEIHYCLESKI